MQLFISLASGLLSLFLALNLNAQIQTVQAFVPHTNEQNQSAELFSALPEDQSESLVIDQAVTNFELLRIDLEELASLKAAPAERLSLRLPNAGLGYQLELTRSYPMAEGFVLNYASGHTDRHPDVGVHYRGSLAGQPNTHVALSILDGEIQGLIALANGQNLVLGPLEQPDQPATDTYILYADDPLFASQDFDCGTEDSGVAYQTEQMNLPATQRSSTGGCVKVYFEVDYNIYQDKGANTAAYVVAAFNEVAALYAAINVDLSISELFIWDQFSPYGGNSSGTLLTQFQAQRPSFNGDIAQLLSYSASGGIAVLSGLCHPISAARMSFSSIGSTFQSVPTYSWTIMVIAHELGHLLGSQHTHACVWNGNGTAIDGCAGFTEGSCGNPGIPQNGGGIMSYCHLTSAGINFNVGFGAQPGAVIFNFVNSAACTNGDACGINPPPPPAADTCDQYSVILELTLDHFGMETTWVLENEAQQILYSGGPYPKKQGGVTKRDTFCLPEACYVLRILDDHDDGICCDYGEGSFQLIGPDDEIIAVGDTFSTVGVIDFCLPDGEPPVLSDSCININFNDYEVVSYGQTQDAGSHSVSSNGNELFIQNNAWKAIELPYDITENTVVAFEFRSTIEGEIHGIGFDDNESISPDFTFRVHGTQGWGNNTFDNYADNEQWQQYVIPVGEFMTGPANYLFFCADHDLGLRNGNSYYRNVKIYEGSPCTGSLATSLVQGIVEPTELLIAPNPVGTELQFTSPATGTYEIISGTGQVLERGPAQAGSQRVLVSELPAGTYLLRYRSQVGEELTRRFVRL